MALLSQLYQSFVGGDADQPGAKFRVTAELGKIGKCLDNSLLGGIFCIGFVVQDNFGRHEHCMFAGTHKFAKGFLVSSERTFDQFRLGRVPLSFGANGAGRGRGPGWSSHFKNPVSLGGVKLSDAVHIHLFVDAYVSRPLFAGVSPFLNHVACQEVHSCYSVGNEHRYEGPPRDVVLRTIVEPTSFRWRSTMNRSKFRMSTMKTLLPEGEPQRLEALRRKIAELEQSQRMLSEQLRQANKALGQSEERFRDLFDEAPIAYVHEGLDSRFIRANRAAMRILGITPDQVAGTYGKNFAPDTPDAQRRLREAFESIGRGTDTSGVVLELRRRDNGKPIWIQWWSKPDPGGQYTRTMFVDITERVLMEQEKARLEAQNTYLQEEIRGEHNFGEVVGNDPKLRETLRVVEQVAATDATVLIFGETGTGKELIARAVH